MNNLEQRLREFAEGFDERHGQGLILEAADTIKFLSEGGDTSQRNYMRELELRRTYATRINELRARLAHYGEKTEEEKV